MAPYGTVRTYLALPMPELTSPKITTPFEATVMTLYEVLNHVKENGSCMENPESSLRTCRQMICEPLAHALLFVI